MTPAPPVFLLSAAGREPILAETLRCWHAATGAPAPAVYLDPARTGHPLTRMLAAYRGLLAAALAASAAPHLLLLEDDLDFAPGFLARLAAWPPWQNGALASFATLFNPGLAPLAPSAGGPSWFIADPARVFGSQALLLARPLAVRAAAAWAELPGHPSQRLAALAAREFPHAPIYAHRPSLIQHTGQVSAWGAPIHRAVDFAVRA